jgi:hypothetical protein
VWSQRIGERMRISLREDDWATVAILLAQLSQKLMTVEVPLRNKIGTPWVGAWGRLPDK